MLFIVAKLRALFAPKPLPVPPPSTYADAEFLEVVARGWRERYQPGPQPGGPAATNPGRVQTGS